MSLLRYFSPPAAVGLRTNEAANSRKAGSMTKASTQRSQSGAVHSTTVSDCA